VVQNSPIYDGCNLADAFLHVCQLNGLPEELFDVQSLTAHTEALGVAYDVTNPAVRFDFSTPLIECARNLAKKFWHVIRTNPDGTIVLTDLNLTGGDPDLITRDAPLESLSPTHDSFVFYIDGSKSPNPFQRIYDSVTINKDFTKQYTNIEILSVDRGGPNEDQAMIFENNSFDIASIEDPDSPDFIGYRKPFKIYSPNFGSREKMVKQRDALSVHVYESASTVTFSTYGRPTMRPYDIIKIVLPEESEDNASMHLYIDGEKTSSKGYNVRVMNISGEIDFEQNMLYTMSITAERI